MHECISDFGMAPLKCLLVALIGSGILATCYPSPLYAQEAALSGSKGPLIQAHPRVLLDPVRLQRLKAAVETDSNLKAELGQLLRRADEFLLAPWDPSEPGDVTRDAGLRDHQQVGNIALGHVESLGLAYLFTGDIRYGNRVKEIALSICRFKRWVSPTFDRYDPPWISTLETTALTQAAGLAYDWCYGLFTEPERALIREAIIQKGVVPTFMDWANPETRNPHGTHQIPHGNWWAACISGGGIGALAVEPEEPEVKRYIGAFESAMRSWLEFDGATLKPYTSRYMWYPPGAWVPQTLDPDGAFYESIGYANFALFSATKFFVSLGRAYGDWGLLSHPRLDKVPEFFAWAGIPDPNRSVKGFGFGDNAGMPGDANVVAALSLVRDDPVAVWYSTRFRKATPPYSLIYSPVVEGEKPPALPDSPPEPLMKTAHLFRGIGWGVLRSGWSEYDTVVGVKSGHNAGHCHKDAGSFEIYYHGEPLLVDSGVSMYTSSLYRSYYRTSRAHNVVLIDGQDQREYTFPGRGQKEPSVEFAIGTDGLALTKADFTEAYSDRMAHAYRYLLLAGPDLVLVIDDLLPKGGSREFEWFFHPNGMSEERNGSIFTERGLLSARVIPLFSRKLSLTQMNGYLTGERQARYYSFGPVVSDSREIGVFAIALNVEMYGDEVQVEELPMSEGIGYRILNRDQEFRVFVGRDGLRGSGIESDAAVVVERVSSEEITGITLVDGRSLVIENKFRFSSLEMSSFVAEKVGEDWKAVGSGNGGLLAILSPQAQRDVAISWSEPYHR